MRTLARGGTQGGSVVRVALVGSALAAAAVTAAPAHAVDGPFVGVNLGASRPVNNNYRAHVRDGVTGDPYVGYMFNNYLGIQGELHFTFQYPDNDHRGFAHENEITTLVGYTLGPRLQLPLIDSPFGQPMEFYVTGQGGGYSGLSGRIRTTGGGASAGGGLDVYLTDHVALGFFGRWNTTFQAPRPTFLANQVADQQGPADASWASGGIGLKYRFNAPPAPAKPAPPPVAQAPAPAPPPAPVKKKIVLRSVHFDFDKSDIRADARPILDEAVQILKEEGTVAVIVAGHTDSVGTDAYNMRLSARRAGAVRDYLVKNGVAADRIKAEGFGESKPVASNDTDDGRQQNRRVELHVN
jgi:outer membrane protein OmpA-like peptidoglycan-associated protein